MNSPLISIIVTFANRDTARIIKSLNSLDNQSKNNFEVILINNSGSIKTRSDFKNLINKFSFVKYIDNYRDGYPWNKSVSLNIGIKNASGKYILIEDADMYFPTDYIENISQKIENSNEDTIIYIFTYYLPEGFNDYKNLVKYKFERGTTSANGNFIIKKEKLLQIGGFDEYYIYWGVEDRDMVRRLELSGIKSNWYEDIFQYHQWHEKIEADTLPAGLWMRKQMYYYANYNKAVRNGKVIGKITNLDERHIFSYLDFDNKTIKANVKVLYYDVSETSVTGVFIEDFFNLKDGEVVGIPNYFFPKKNNFINFAIKIIYKIIRLSGFKSRVNYVNNLLHGTIIELIEKHPEFIKDYFIGFPDKKYNGITLLMKNEFKG